MNPYQLTIDIPSDGLKTLYAANQFVTIVKSVPHGVPVAWVSFRPMLSNTITWTEAYSVYASTTGIQEGATIITQSTKPAGGGKMYTLRGGQFDDGKDILSPRSCGVYNSDDVFTIDDVRMVTCGLHQGVTVNGTSTAGAVNAVAVPYQDEAVFTPIERVQIFASSFQNNGLVISSVTSAALEVDLTTVQSQALRYNPAVNRFAIAA